MNQQIRKKMSFLNHLEALRWHLIRSAFVIIAISCIAFFMYEFIFDDIIFGPKNPDFITYRFFCNLGLRFNIEDLCIDKIPFIIQSRTMGGQFSAHVWTSFTAGFIISFPYIIWEIWRFISSGLYILERKNTRNFVVISSFLFFTGVLFGYYLITPLSINFFGNYKISDQVNNNIDLDSYIELIRSTVLGCGLIFELPIVMYFLTKMGLITPEFLRRYRKHALIIVLIIAGIITPPDILSQIIVSIPILFLYEVSIIISGIVLKKQQVKL